MWQGIATRRTWLSGECSRKDTTTSRLRGKSPRSRSATATTCSMRNHPASSAPPSRVRPTACRRRSHWPFTTKRGRMRRSSRSLSFAEYLLLRPQPGARRYECHVPGGSESKRRPGQRHSDRVRHTPRPRSPTDRTVLGIQLRTLVQLQFCPTETRASAGRLGSTKLGRWSERYRGRTAGFTPAEDSKDRTRRPTFRSQRWQPPE